MSEIRFVCVQWHSMRRYLWTLHLLFGEHRSNTLINSLLAPRDLIVRPSYWECHFECCLYQVNINLIIRLFWNVCPSVKRPTLRHVCSIVLGLNDLSVYDEDAGETKPSNPFKQLQKPPHSLLDVAMEVLQTMTCRKGTSKSSANKYLNWSLRQQQKIHLQRHIKHYSKLIGSMCVVWDGGGCWNTVGKYHFSFPTFLKPTLVICFKCPP